MHWGYKKGACVRLIQVTRSSLPPLEEYIDEIKDLWESRRLTNMGEKHQQLAAALRTFLDVCQLTLFSNGHLALEAALSVLGLQGEVITTPFSFASTTHALVRCGLKPVFCDIRPDDYTLDPERIAEKINSKTCAILPVHVYGQVCRLDAIQQLADQYHLKLIYDSAHAFGVTAEGHGIGQYGDISMFSFHATKAFNTIEGGALAYRDHELSRQLDLIKNFGIASPESVAGVGGNAKMNEFQAAMGLCNLRHFNDEIEKRFMVDARYRQHLSGLPGLQLPVRQTGVVSNHAYFPIVFLQGKQKRDHVHEHLSMQGIMARKYFYPLISDYQCYAGQFDSGETPIARQIADSVLCLPIYADLAIQDVDLIGQLIQEVVL